ncbi:hypothetical protein BDZ85DRAFT_270854 [Elsinoe ampelina]|uniref:F-box domain-containing protein n=1 Tax=Elsinoe ampelina TaxID=302913 RepID=A0A6A6FXI9_9PEZI|nr:hypothetical protein BDZ85DRAFT_270854 [Elsinoe ampelina]
MPTTRIPRTSLWDCIGDSGTAVLEMLDRDDIRTLTLLSKSMRRDSEPYLYSNIEWKWTVDHTPPILSFLYVILRRPELAGHVRTVQLLGSDLHKAPSRGDRPPAIPISGKVDSEIVSAVVSSGLSFVDHWLSELQKGSMDAAVTLMLGRLHSLRKLVLDRNFTKSNVILGFLLRSIVRRESNTELSNFSHLETVTWNTILDNDISMIGVRTPDLLPLFLLPKMTSMSLCLDGPSIIEWPLETIRPSSITTLDLAYIREQALGDVLANMPNLQNLRWSWYYRPWTRHTDNTVLDLKVMAASLGQVRESLQQLMVFARCEQDGPEMPLLHITGHMEGLCEMLKLRRLEIPLPFLAGFSPASRAPLERIMPVNLHTLVITDNFYPYTVYDYEVGWEREQDEWELRDIKQLLTTWLRQHRSRCPDLHTIHLCLFQAAWEDVEDLEDTEPASLSIGVHWSLSGQ